jgi:hypothetical protein
MFSYHSLDLWSLWSGGKRAQRYVHVELKVNRSESGQDKFALLREAYNIVKEALGEKGEQTEIQTQLVELTASETVMTNE